MSQAKQCFVIHVSGTLEVFDVMIEKQPFLDRVSGYLERTTSGITIPDRDKMGKILDGRISEVFSEGLMPVTYFGSHSNVTVYLGTYGVREFSAIINPPHHRTSK